MIRPLIAGAALSLGLLASTATASDLTNLSDAERDALRAEMRAYLLDNPEVLMEAIAVLEDRQANQQNLADVALVAENAEALFDDGFSWVGGNPDGDITIVEFTDYRCGYCRKAHDEVAELIASDGNIKFIVKEFPILGEASELSSRFAIATKIVDGPEAYKKAHDALIKMRGNPSIESLSTLADKLKLTTDEVMATMLSARVDEEISATRALAQRMQIAGTPTFVVKETMLRGYVPLEGMRQIVAQSRAN